MSIFSTTQGRITWNTRRNINMSEAFLVSLYAQSDTVRLKFFHIHSGIILFIIISNTDDHLTVKFKRFGHWLKKRAAQNILMVWWYPNLSKKCIWIIIEMSKTIHSALSVSSTRPLDCKDVSLCINRRHMNRKAFLLGRFNHNVTFVKMLSVIEN